MPKFALLESKVAYLSYFDAQRMISTSDHYSQNLTNFDLQSKIQSKSPDLSEADYLANASRFVRGWTTDETIYLKKIIDWLNTRLSSLKPKFKLPEEILFVKTTGQEEGGANGYTRDNAIYLNQHSLSKNLVIHELFHIISKFNPKLISAAYELLGFNTCNEIVIDDPLRITNPDAPYLRHYLTVNTVKNKVDVVFIIRAKSQYTGGSFFRLVEKKLLTLEGNGKIKKPKIVNGKLQYLNFGDVVDLYDNIGRNTGYNIHQEETTAEHFEHIVNAQIGISHPNLVTGLQKILFY